MATDGTRSCGDVPRERPALQVRARARPAPQARAARPLAQTAAVAGRHRRGTLRVVALTPRPDDEFEAALTALAQSEGVSRQEAVRRAVLERHERAGYRAGVQDSAHRLTERWGDLLRRLADT